MARYEFGLADVSDEPELRELLHRIEMPGRVAVKMLRDPSFFDGNDLSPGLNQTLVCRDSDDGSIVGFGCRTVRDHRVDARVEPLGYLHMLRSIERVRSGSLLARAFRYLQQLHGDGATSTYLTTVAAGNDRATSVLTGARAGLPAYRSRGTYQTFVVPARRRRRDAPDVSIASMADVGVDETVEFISVQGAANHSVFPAYERRDFGDDASTFKGLDPADVLVAFERGRIVGTLGVWDQRRFRQTVVTGYSRSIRVARRLHNGCARLRGQIRLPTAGSVLPVACAAVPVIATGRVDVAAALLDRASSLAGERGLDAILVGSHEQSEWCRPASSSAAIRYDTTVYEVGWNGARAAVGPGVPYLELGVL